MTAFKFCKGEGEILEVGFEWSLNWEDQWEHVSPCTGRTSARVRADKGDVEGVVEFTSSGTDSILNKWHGDSEYHFKETTPRRCPDSELLCKVDNLAIAHEIGDLNSKISKLVDWRKEVSIAVIIEWSTECEHTDHTCLRLGETVCTDRHHILLESLIECHHSKLNIACSTGIPFSFGVSENECRRDKQ